MKGVTARRRVASLLFVALLVGSGLAVPAAAESNAVYFHSHSGFVLRDAASGAPASSVQGASAGGIVLRVLGVLDPSTQGAPPSTVTQGQTVLTPGQVLSGGVQGSEASAAGAPSSASVMTLTGPEGPGAFVVSSAGMKETFTAAGSPGGPGILVTGFAGSPGFFPGTGQSAGMAGQQAGTGQNLVTSTVVTGVELYGSEFEMTATNMVPRLWLDSPRRRPRSQIYIEVLELLTQGSMTPFEISFHARLNHKRTKEYLEFLRAGGFLESSMEDGHLRFAVTQGGRAFVEKARMLFEIGRSPTSRRFLY